MNGIDSNMEDPGDFFRAVQQAAEVSGACVLEHFTCPSCSNKQVTAHPFRERILCAKCKHAIPSRVPRQTQPGEVTGDMLTEAIETLRRSVPVVDRNTIEWIDKQEGAVKVVAITYSTHAIHQALNAIQDIARKMSGGHQA